MDDEDAVGVVARQVVRFYEEVWNGPDLSGAGSLLHPEMTFRGSLGYEGVGYAAFLHQVESITEALGDYHCEIVRLVAEPAAAAARMVFSGVHRGRFLGFAPSGARLTWTGAAFFTFEGPLIRDLWVLGDLVTLHGQLEASRQPQRPDR